MEAIPGRPADCSGSGQRHQVRGSAGTAYCEEEVAGGGREKCQAAEGAGGHAGAQQVGHRKSHTSVDQMGT